MSNENLVSALRTFAAQVRNFKNDPGMLAHVANEMDRAATANDPRYPQPEEAPVVEAVETVEDEKPEETPDPVHKTKKKAKKK